MNFIDKTAHNWTNFIRHNYQDAASEKVLFYALSLLINTSLAYFVTLLICLITHHLLQGLLVIVFYTVLRILSGGVHFSTSLRCCVYSILVFVIVSHSNFHFHYLHLGVILTISTSLILLLYAPEGIENISKINVKYYPLLKFFSICLVLSNLYFASSILSIAYLVQAIHITKFGYYVISLIERALDYIQGKGEVLDEK